MFLLYPHRPPAYLSEDAYDQEHAAWSVCNTHDPFLTKSGEYYYVFSTDAMYGKREDRALKGAVQVRRSRNLIDWEWFGYALNEVPKDAYEWTGAKGIWAPDVCKIGDKYALYYCASQFGTNQSFIGVAFSDSIEGPWTDHGEVYKTSKTQFGPNAIDPNTVVDRDGRLWMVYGSFFAGIHISELDPETGKLKEYGKGTLLACREHSTKQGSVEGPYIVYHPDFDEYYLFVSYDSLFTQYNIRVGRSKNITGPYVDYHGIALTDTMTSPNRVGTMIAAGYQFTGHAGWRATGHNSVLRDGNEFFMAHHARIHTDPHKFSLHIRKMLWTEDGWPVVSPERYGGETLQPLSNDDVLGSWERIRLDPDFPELVQASHILQLFQDGKVIKTECGIQPSDSSVTCEGQWIFKTPYALELVWNTDPPDLDNLLVMPGWDWERERPALVWTGLSKDGLAVWGKKTE